MFLINSLPHFMAPKVSGENLNYSRKNDAVLRFAIVIFSSSLILLIVVVVVLLLLLYFVLALHLLIHN
jgi:hypothetical protein